MYECVYVTQQQRLCILWHIKPRVGSGAVRIGPTPFPVRGHKRRTKSGCRLFCYLGQFFFCFSFVFLMSVVLCLIVFGCQYQCN